MSLSITEKDPCRSSLHDNVRPKAYAENKFGDENITLKYTMRFNPSKVLERLRQTQTSTNLFALHAQTSKTKFNFDQDSGLVRQMQNIQQNRTSMARKTEKELSGKFCNDIFGLICKCGKDHIQHRVKLFIKITSLSTKSQGTLYIKEVQEFPDHKHHHHHHHQHE